MSDRSRNFWRSPIVWPIAGIVLLVLANIIRDPGYLSVALVDGHFTGVPIDILRRGALITIVALGMTLVIATGGIDLSVGSVVAVTGAVAAVLIGHGVQSLPLIVGVAVFVGGLAGVLNGALVAFAGVQPIVATLILMVAGRGVAQLITGGNVLLIKHAGFEYLGNGFLAALPLPALIAAAMFIATFLALRKTAGRLFIEAVGDNPIASCFAGLPTSRVTWFVYVFSGLCAGVAGVLATSNIRAADSLRAGENMELDAIFAVVVGGTALSGGRFLLLGSFVGGILLQTLTVTMYNVGVPPHVATVPKALLILLVCILQSDRTRRWFRGLFGKGRAA